ncbi:hypothetical protein ABBQ32_007348 [Trebouxia sp. C0010 RCD-2024]
MTEVDLEQKLASWDGAQTPDYGALCSDLAQLKLNKGDVGEAQQLFQRALAVTEAAHTQAEEGNASDDDWELCWEQNMQHMQQPRKPALLEPRKGYAKPSQKPQLMQPSAYCSRRQNDEGSEDSDEMTIPFDGLHLLECYGMTQYNTVLKLEDFLRHLQWSSVAPVVRPVDETHALVVCANPADARSLLQTCGQPACQWQLQPFNQACVKSKALKAGELQPPRVRQKTTTAVARRLIGNALRVKGVHDKDAELQLKSQHAEKKEAQAQKQRLLEAAWEEG